MIEKMPQFDIVNIVDGVRNDLEFSRGPYEGKDRGRRFQIGNFFFTTKSLEVLVLRKQGLSLKQIGVNLGISYAAAKQRLCYLRNLNRKDINSQSPGIIKLFDKTKSLGLLNPIVLVALKGLDKKDS